MAEEEPQTQSIQARIAALNIGQVGKAPVTATPNNLGIRTSQKPPLDHRRNTATVPVQRSPSGPRYGIENEPAGLADLPSPVVTRTRQQQNISSNRPTPPTPPRLPPRTPSIQKSPALPPRRPSQQLSQRDSSESISSIVSTISSVSGVSNGTARTPTSRNPSIDAGRVRAPVYDPSTLPPLPPKRSQKEKEKDLIRIPLKGAKSTPSITTIEVLPAPHIPTVPQRPLARDHPQELGRKLPPKEPPPMPARSLPPSVANEHIGEGEHNSILPQTPSKSLPPPIINGYNHARVPSPTPPPIPLSSRPDLSKSMAAKPRLDTTLPPSASSYSSVCLKCRDFSEPDSHAAKFPRHTVPSLGWLAEQLCSPFPDPIDRARVIFTWLHHNVEYDVYSFFNNCVKPATPESTLSSGLAVCAGYAGLFTAIASKVGLESIVISGHGKGYGNKPVPPGAPIPPESSNHAWNAYKDSGGCWRLVDCTWGAGAISGAGQPYNKRFAPIHFVQDGNEFGIKHFPSNKSYFFRTDGRAQIPWTEYILGDQVGEPVQVYSNIAPREGLSDTKFLPKQKRISTNPSDHSGPTIRFQFERACEHWDPLVNGPGKPYQYVLATAIGDSGKSGDWIPFETNGMFWWLDVPPKKLGTKGQHIIVYTIDTINGKDARGVTKAEYLQAKGRSAMSFQGVCAWDLV